VRNHPGKRRIFYTKSMFNYFTLHSTEENNFFITFPWMVRLHFAAEPRHVATFSPQFLHNYAVSFIMISKSREKVSSQKEGEDVPMRG
jgi:hypothetical protein